MGRVTYRIVLTVVAAVLLGTWAADTARATGETAAAELKFVDGSDAGSIKLTQTPAGALLKINLKGLKPGPHGLQVHKVGKCDGDFATAGPIYNPLAAKHGFLNDEGPMAGDLPNVYASTDGTVIAEILSPFLHVDESGGDSLFDSDGSALVLFEKTDDYKSNPEGAAGARIACGVLKNR
jgi:Cu-Zn family superoxide dismutase